MTGICAAQPRFLRATAVPESRQRTSIVNESQTTPAVCSYLEWDSNFFGVRIGRIESRRLDPDVLAAATEWAHENRMDCLYFLSVADDPQTVHLAERNQFQQVDVRMTFERNVPAAGPERAPLDARIRLAEEKDLPALRAIATVSHHDTRFYFDGYFDRTRCDQLYETWIEKSLHGFAQAVLVAERDAQPVGYVTLNLREVESQIGLIAIAAGHQGAGLGRVLVEHSLDWARTKGARVMKVVTQGRNVPAQRLYQRCGFLTGSFELWYHRWFRR